MNNTCPPVRLSTLAIAAALAIGCTNASAGYAVIDDDLLPTAMAQARHSQWRNEQFSLQFLRDRNSLTDANRGSLDVLLPRMQQAHIRIVGRPDAIVASAEKAAALADSRASSIRDYLIRKGVPSSAISVDINPSPNNQANAGGSPSEVWIGPGASQFASPAFQRHQPQGVEEFLQTSSATQSVGTVGNEQLMRYINEALKNGQMEPSVALTLIRQMTAAQPPRPAAPQPQNAQPTQPQYREAVYQPVSYRTATYQAPNQWPIRAGLSLRQNVAAWAQTEGYELVWDLPPNVNAQFQSDRYLAAPTFADAIRILIESLHAKGYRFIAANLYQDRVVQFTTDRPTL